MKKNNTIGVSINSTPKPEAWIAVSNNRQKIYGESKNQVYLDNNQEFQIELFNPTDISYLAKIYLNGNLISSSGLVIKPGQRYFLDRFIDEKKKLVFSTYYVDNNEEVKKAIANNGIVRVEFYSQQFPSSWSNTYVYSPNLWGGAGTNTHPNTTGGIYWTNNWGTAVSTGANISTTGMAFGNSSLTSGASFTNTSGVLSTNCVNYSSNIAGSLETGRVEKGESSGQEFGSDYGTYSLIANYVSEYNILPRSTKPIEVEEIRSYCTCCGTRIKKKTWKFCPDCGNGLND